MRVLFLLSIVFCSSVAVAQSEGNCDHKPAKKITKKYEQALKLYSTGQKPEGVTMMKEITELDPLFVNPYFFLGRHYFKTVFPESMNSAEKLTNDQEKSFKEKAKFYYEESNKICPAFSGHLASYYLGTLSHMAKEYEKSAEYLKYYLDNEGEVLTEDGKVAKRLYKESKTVSDLLKHPVPYDPQLVKGLNTKDDEYVPMLSPDNEQLYFTRQLVGSTDPTKTGGAGNDKREYFSVASKLSVDSFSSGIPLPFPFNDFLGQVNGEDIWGQGAACITPDNKRMYLTVVTKTVLREGPAPNASIYYSDLIAGNWTPLKSIGRNINDEGGNPTWEGQPTISSDGKMIIFASVRETCMSSPTPVGNKLSMDLFMINKNKDGSWSAPKSLGDVINTKGDEKTPFLHTDSRTLYFSSNGHPGVGGTDIFYTRMDDYGNWMTPVNLGAPINTAVADHGFMVSLDGQYGFLSSGAKGDANGGLQIIHFPLYAQARPENVVLVKGKLTDEKGAVLKDGKVEIKNAKTGQITEGLVDKQTGEYVVALTTPDPERNKEEKRKVVLTVEGEKVEADFGSHVEKVNGKEKIIEPGAKVDSIKGVQVIIPADHKKVKVDGEEMIVALTPEEKSAPAGEFVITAKAEGKAFSSKIIEVDPKKPAKIIRSGAVAVEALEVKKPIRLNDIVFGNDSYELTRKSKLILDQLYDFLIANGKIDVAIHGHTDNVGDDAKNLLLSKNRAKACMEYLISRGISAKRLSSEGYGETKPKTVNTTEEGRAANRRVEFVILKM
ncbi:MAG: OmpA family protein [Bacteroidetes bacterium]|nr:OmpA family protein [Bacteroidota bacterium]